MNRNRKRILIIDDDRDFQLLLTTILKAAGFEVKSLLEGNVDHTLDSATSCDIVLMDVDLPGVDGIELIKHLKSSEETVKIPVVLLTAHSESDTLFIECQANDLFKKPFSVSALLEKINELLNRLPSGMTTVSGSTRSAITGASGRETP